MTAFAASLTQRRGPTQISRKTQNLGTQSDLLILRGKKDDEIETRFRGALRGKNERKHESG
jgi:hypothetical protein